MSAFLRPDASDTVRLTAEKGAGVAARVEGGHQSENRTRLVWVFPKPAAEAAVRAESFAPTRVGAFRPPRSRRRRRPTPRAAKLHRPPHDRRPGRRHPQPAAPLLRGRTGQHHHERRCGRARHDSHAQRPWDQALDVVLRARASGRCARATSSASRRSSRSRRSARPRSRAWAVRRASNQDAHHPGQLRHAADLMGKAREF